MSDDLTMHPLYKGEGLGITLPRPVVDLSASNAPLGGRRFVCAPCLDGQHTKCKGDCDCSQARHWHRRSHHEDPTEGEERQTEWETHPDFYEACCKRYGTPTWDLCATQANSKCGPSFYGTGSIHAQDAFTEPWGGSIYWMNPPYGPGIKNMWWDWRKDA